GDELGRSQRGNNNPYSQDNEISWTSWDLEPWQEDLLETTRHLVRLRRDHPVLRQREFFSGRQIHEGGSTDLAWFAADGELMGHRWDGPAIDVLQALYNGAWFSQQSVLIVVNGSARKTEVTLPDAPGVTAYQLLWDSCDARPTAPGEPVRSRTVVTMDAASMRVWCSVTPD
ncbi:MAG: glycogen debranching enzyme GlgX, partial [Terrabacter sp.]